MCIALITAIIYASRRNPNLYVSSKRAISDVCMETIGTPDILNIPLCYSPKGCNIFSDRGQDLAVTFLLKAAWILPLHITRKYPT